MSTATRTTARPTVRRTAGTGAARTALIVGAAVIVAVAVNALIAFAAVAAGAPSDYSPLLPPAYASLTAIAVIVGWFGWKAVRTRARDPRRTLGILVPVIGVLSFLPDVILLTTGFIPGTTAIAVLALMAMHVTTLAIAIPAYVLAGRAKAAASA